MQGFSRRFKYPIRVPGISNRVPRIRENRVRIIKEIASLQIQTGFLTFSLKITLGKCLKNSKTHAQKEVFGFGKKTVGIFFIR